MAPRLRAPKAILVTVAFGLLGAVLSLLFATAAVLLFHYDPRHAGSPTAQDALVQGVSALLGFGLATWVVGRIGLGLSWSDLRWRASGTVITAGFGWGLALGGLAAGLAMLLAVPLGGAGWAPDGGSFSAYLGRAAATLAVLAPAALSEEVIFRGLPMVILGAAFGRRGVIVGLAVLFAVAHLGNPDISALALGNIALAGVLLGVAFYAPGGLWTAFGVHLGWNGILAALAAPVSGVPFPIPWLDYRTGGPGWLTGGSFGPEGGLLATCMIALAIVVAARRAGENLR